MKILTIEPEFSHPVAVEKIPAGGLEETLVANDDECRKLALRFALVSLDRLQATMNLQVTHAGQIIQIDGLMAAHVVQQCVVSLEHLPARIEQDIHVLYAKPGAENLVTELDDEAVEIVENGTIDLGELVAQHLGAALDPYPRKQGLEFINAEYGQPDRVVSPFARLVDLKKDHKD